MPEEKIPNGRTFKKESKADLFTRLAKPRTQNVIDKIKILGNCANKNSYEYTIEQTDKMFDAIQIVLNNTRDKFNSSIEQKELFEF